MKYFLIVLALFLQNALAGIYDYCQPSPSTSHVTFCSEYANGDIYNRYNGFDPDYVQTAIFENCAYTKIPTDIFTHFSNLNYLKMDYCDIKTLNPIISSKLFDLNLAANGIKTISTNTFSQVGYLRNLNLEKNQISQLESESFSGLSDLRNLNLKRNKLVELPSSVFTRMASLDILDLSNNQLESIESELFPITLRILDLSGNSINYIHPDAFANLKLNYLDISGNSIKKLIIHSVQNFIASKASLTDVNFATASNMKKFIANDNKLTSIEFMGKIDEINLSNNELKSIGFVKGSSATDLDISRNPRIVHNLTNILANIDVTGHLNLSSIQLTFDQMESFMDAKLSKLISLDLSENSLDFFNFTHLQNLKNLQQLDISYNQISNVNFKNVKTDFLNGLQSISLIANKWNCTNLRDLIKFSKRNHIQVKSNTDTLDELEFYQFYVAGIGCFTNIPGIDFSVVKETQVAEKDDSVSTNSQRYSELKIKMEKYEKRVDNLEDRLGYVENMITNLTSVDVE